MSHDLPKGNFPRLSLLAKRNAAGLCRRRLHSGTLPPLRGLLEPEADAANTGEVVILDIAVGNAALRYRIHNAGIRIPLREELPVEHRRVHLVSASALAVGAGRGKCPRRSRIDFGSIHRGAGDVQIAGDAVFGAGPDDLEDFISATGAGAAEGIERIVIDRGQVSSRN